MDGCLMCWIDWSWRWVVKFGTRTVWWVGVGVVTCPRNVLCCGTTVPMPWAPGGWRLLLTCLFVSSHCTVWLRWGGACNGCPFTAPITAGMCPDCDRCCRVRKSPRRRGVSTPPWCTSMTRVRRWRLTLSSFHAHGGWLPMVLPVLVLTLAIPHTLPWLWTHTLTVSSCQVCCPRVWRTGTSGGARRALGLGRSCMGTR